MAIFTAADSRKIHFRFSDLFGSSNSGAWLPTIAGPDHVGNLLERTTDFPTRSITNWKGIEGDDCGPHWYCGAVVYIKPSDGDDVAYDVDDACNEQCQNYPLLVLNT
jgi:hypothetical protein